MRSAKNQLPDAEAAKTPQKPQKNQIQSLDFFCGFGVSSAASASGCWF
jgi:hypothetical protein